MAAPARLAAFQALRAVCREGLDLGSALARARAGLGDDRDRALVTELVTGTLRTRAALDYQIDRCSGRPVTRLDPEVLDVLRLGAFQIVHLTRVPPAAVVNDSVTLVHRAGKSSARGLVNAVLRRIARERDRLPWPPRPDDHASLADWTAWLAVTASHPAWLVERWLRRHGRPATEAWLAFNNLAPPVCLATNLRRTTPAELAEALAEEGIDTAPARVAPAALLVTRGRALASAAYRDGRCHVQDEASQLVALVPEVADAMRVYDACAAPGGKTIGLAGRARLRLLVAADVRPGRVALLRRTLDRAGLTDVPVLQVGEQGALPFRDASFDVILLDAPCSGLGTVRRDPDIKWRREPADLEALAVAQLALLERAQALVARGGQLVYATCSSEPEENEAVIAAFLERHPAFAVRPIARLAHLPPSVGTMATPEGYLRTLPYRDGLEAFFAAVLVKL
ncbi:MAG: 16S rRNA (cytosine(967)-C(5))-methyltransferase RsmB [Acidobacteriota bacterium]